MSGSRNDITSHNTPRLPQNIQFSLGAYAGGIRGVRSPPQLRSSFSLHVITGVDLHAGLLGTHGERRRGSVPNGVKYGEGCPSQPTRGSAERRELPQRSLGKNRPETDFRSILKATERFFL